MKTKRMAVRFLSIITALAVSISTAVSFPVTGFAASFITANKQIAMALPESARKVKEMREAQANFRKTRIAGWDYKAQRLEKEIDEMLTDII